MKPQDLYTCAPFLVPMAIEDPSEDSIMAVLRTEVRARPVRLASLLLFLIAAALLMPSAEVHEAGKPVVISSHADSIGVSSPTLMCLSSAEQPAAGDEKTTLDAETLTPEKLPLTPPRIACFPEHPETAFPFR